MHLPIAFNVNLVQLLLFYNVPQRHDSFMHPLGLGVPHTAGTTLPSTVLAAICAPAAMNAFVCNQAAEGVSKHPRGATLQAWLLQLTQVVCAPTKVHRTCCSAAGTAGNTHPHTMHVIHVQINDRLRLHALAAGLRERGCVAIPCSTTHMR